MIDVQVFSEWNYGGQYHYSVWVNGEKYDEFTSTSWLTQSELNDVAAGYAEGLTEGDNDDEVE